VTYNKDLNLICADVDFDPDDALTKKVKSFNVADGVILVMNSYGGDVNKALDLYDYLKTRNFTTVVSAYCVSSCAQFIFLGAKNRYVLGDGTVLMHGAPFDDKELSSPKIPKAVLAPLISVNNRYRTFLKDNRIPSDLVVGGKQSTGYQVVLDGTALWMPSKLDYAAAGIAVNYCDAEKYK